MNKEVKRRRGLSANVAWLLVAMVIAVTMWAVQEPAVQDFWAGLGYEASDEVAQLQDELRLTKTGKRIFAATQPSVEESAGFNEHCRNEYDLDVALLGCYVDGKIYVYRITDEQLIDVNKVTLAHELLHAHWERMSDKEREKVQKLLKEVYKENQSWLEEELETYDEAAKLEEIYTRVGTKMAELPEELEAHYAEIFEERGRIVQFYQNYEAPFVALNAEMESLREQIEAVWREVAVEREEYREAIDELNARIGEFNECAETAGCFNSKREFNQGRASLEAETRNLEKRRDELNQRITKNNERVYQYQEKQKRFGDLNRAINSRVEAMDGV